MNILTDRLYTTADLESITGLPSRSWIVEIRRGRIEAVRVGTGGHRAHFRVTGAALLNFLHGHGGGLRPSIATPGGALSAPPGHLGQTEVRRR